EPVAGADVELLGASPAIVAKTDANGVALLRGVAQGVIRARAADAELELSLRDGRDAKQLFPELATGSDVGTKDRRALIVTDRGIYRPGAKLFASAALRRPDGDRLVAVSGEAVRLRVVGPTGEDVATQAMSTTERGAAAAEFAIPGDAKLGRHQV